MSKYELILSTKFKKSMKLAKKRGLNLHLLEKIVEILLQGIPLETKYRDHELQGKYKGFRECHIQPDWLLIYLVNDDVLVLTLVDTGTHSDLFKL
ncbi:MAG: type II toxin-antitoxin system YafQ family toxin [Eubacteriales bacterium]